MVTLKSNDDKELEVKEAALMQSEMIKNRIEEGCATGVIVYLNKHIPKDEDEDEGEKEDRGKAGSEDDLKEFDEQFLIMDFEDLFDIIIAVNYLNIHELMELCCQSAADRLKTKTVRAICEMLKITNDLTEEEEQEIINDAPWASESPEIDDNVN
ncbi:unnamed protein product [Withania somnifera]